mmetsp:Transcript_3280/g.7128  ORF Transcript_3280/g.7128 Transcript_3280/m.7128 type:complete len:205 (-) Transcript_3280:139-753(-)
MTPAGSGAPHRKAHALSARMRRRATRLVGRATRHGSPLVTTTARTSTRDSQHRKKAAGSGAPHWKGCALSTRVCRRAVRPSGRSTWPGGSANAGRGRRTESMMIPSPQVEPRRAVWALGRTASCARGKFASLRNPCYALMAIAVTTQPVAKQVKFHMARHSILAHFVLNFGCNKGGPKFPKSAACNENITISCLDFPYPLMDNL